MSTVPVPSGATRWSRAAGALLLGVFVAGFVAAVTFERRAGIVSDPLENVVMFAGFAWFAVLGALIVARQPRNAMGWVFAAIALTVGCFPAGNAWAASILASGGEVTGWVVAAAWPNTWYWMLLLALVLGWIPLLFPDGRLPTPRWRPFGWFAGVFTAALCASGALGPTVGIQNTELDLPNPLHVPGLVPLEHHPLGAVGAAVFLLGAIAAVVVRFRRSRGTERQQLKWFLAAVALIPLAPLGEALASVYPPIWPVVSLSFALTLNAIPLAIGLAVLRYRLWDIDRIISRTLAWALVTGSLGAVYLAGVVLLSSLVRPLGASSDLAVAGSTLLAATAFRPIRRATQRLVDRRFNRSRYDAQRTVAAFRHRLRGDVHLDDVTAELLSAVHATVQPAGVSLWVRPDHGAPR